MCCENPFLEQAKRIKAYVKKETGLDFKDVPQNVVDSLSDRWGGGGGGGVCLHAENYRDCMKKKKREKKKAENRRKKGKEDWEKK